METFIAEIVFVHTEQKASSKSIKMYLKIMIIAM